MAINEDNLVAIPFNRGMDNRSKETKLEEGFIRLALNVDISETATRRPGRNLLLALPGAHSLWAHPLIEFGLVADGDTLYRLNSDLTVEPLRSVTGRPISYAFNAHRVWWSDGTDSGSVDTAGELLPWGVPTPNQTYSAAAHNAGGLNAGEYQVTITYLSARGEESGSPESLRVTIAQGQGILVTGIPTHADAVTVRVYVSSPNDKTLRQAVDIPAGMTQVLIGNGPRGARLETQLMHPVPAGEFILSKARLYSYSNGRIYFSAAMRPGLCNPIEHNVPIPGIATMLAAPESQGFTIYVGTTTRTYVLTGASIDDHERVQVSARGVLRGSMAMVPGDALGIDGVFAPTPVWIDTDGQFIAGLSSGILPLNNKVATDAMRNCAAAFIDRDGFRKMVVSGEGGTRSKLGVSDTAELIVVSHGAQ